MKAYKLFEYLSEHTWRRIARCHRNRLHLSEDTITTINLDALITASPGFVAIEDTRVDEARKGCDFELWVGSISSGWIRYAVQAKKLKAASGRYDSLNHVVKKSGKSQIDILEDYSAANRAYPIYCFYNITQPPASKPKPWAKGFNWNCCEKKDELQLGCSITPASVVRKAISKGPRNFNFIHSQNETLPWRCLVKCNGQCSSLNGKKEIKNKFEVISGWHGLSKCVYKRLPDSLSMLLEEGISKRTPFDQLDNLFSGDSEYRPEWIGVLDITKE